MNEKSDNLKRYVFSYGGSGCTSIRNQVIQQVGSHLVPEIHPKLHKHARNPPKNLKPAKVCYVYANPMNVVISFFSRQIQGFDFPRFHVQNLSGLPIQPRTSLEAFLERGVDCFGLYDHWRNWAKCESKDYPLLLLRYETMVNHFDKVAAFFEIDNKFIFKERKSDWTQAPRHIQRALETMYRDLWSEIKSFGEFRVI